MLACYQIEKGERRNFREIRHHLREKELYLFESDRCEFLLHNMLPNRIVQRLKTQPVRLW
jgi:hypothetical protein